MVFRSCSYGRDKTFASDSYAITFTNWTQNKKIDGQFSVHVELKSAHPVLDVRVPSYSAIAQVQQTGEGAYTVDMATQDAALDRDFILYYRLADDLPGRVEVIPYRADPNQPATFDFPETDTDNPELERLWALNQIEQHRDLCRAGVLPPAELEQIERDLGTKYQLVTDETSMIVLSDQVFAERGIGRRNQQRVATERAAQARRVQQPAQNYTISNGQQTFPTHAPRLGGGGAIDPFTALGALAAAAMGFGVLRRRRG